MSNKLIDTLREQFPPTQALTFLTREVNNTIKTLELTPLNESAITAAALHSVAIVAEATIIRYRELKQSGIIT